MSELCRKKLTVTEYLKHMIDHHQVAVDISRHMIGDTKWDRLQEILYKIIWTQEWEITYMKSLLKTMPENISLMGKQRNVLKTKTSTHPPNVKGLSKTYCDPMFFDPEEHSKHFGMHKLTEQYYIEHMIPHHQVAVDMSKRILEDPQNDAIVSLAYRIIRSQEAEIVLLDSMKNSYKYHSTLITGQLK